MKDTYKHQGMRRKLVAHLRKRGIEREHILNAFLDIPRHYFIDSAFARHAYEDKPFPISCEQTISQPYTVAMQTTLLEVQPGDQVLEIGTGSGFQAAVLSYIGARVYSLERYEKLHLDATHLLEKLGFGAVRTMLGDGMLGLPSRAPFDKILVTAGAMEVPETLLDQLAPGGILVIPVGEDEQVMKRIIKNQAGEFITETHGYYQFVPLLGGTVRE